MASFQRNLLPDPMFLSRAIGRAGSTSGGPLPKEFVLAAACSRWPPSDSRNSAIEVAATSPVDWEKFVRVATRQRVIGLAHDGLKRARVAVPGAIAKAIAEAASAQLRQNLIFAGEVVRIQRAFDEHKLAVTFFKGVPTAIDIYGDIAIRHSKDLDLLVSQDRMALAEWILETLGYRRVAPPAGIGSARVQTLLLMGKDFVYAHKDNPSLEVELHWRLFNNAEFMRTLAGAGSRRSYPALDNVCLTTFSNDDQFAYLCAHGGSFAWCRLKWLADIGALLSREEPRSLRRLYESAAERGAARPAAQAILLCRRLLGTDVPDDLAELLHRDSVVRRLEELAITAMIQGGAEAEPYDLPSGMNPINRSLWLMGGSVRYLYGEVNSRWISWDDVVTVPLPRGLQFLYPVLRIPLWIWRRTAKSRHHPG